MTIKQKDDDKKRNDGMTKYDINLKHNNKIKENKTKC